MKYKRQLMSSMFALALLASGISVFAADIPTTGIKATQQTNQVRMKSNNSDSIIDAKDKNGKDIERKDDVVKKVNSVKHTKNKKTHKVKATATVVKPTQ